MFRRLKASDQSEILSALIAIGKQKGFRANWAKFKFKALFGHWPQIEPAESAKPSSDLLTWLERERRRYGTAYKKQRMKIEAEARGASTLALARIEAILGELEANPLVRDPLYRQASDREALMIADRICAKKASVPGGDAT